MVKRFFSDCEIPVPCQIGVSELAENSSVKMASTSFAEALRTVKRHSPAAPGSPYRSIQMFAAFARMSVSGCHPARLRRRITGIAALKRSRSRSYRLFASK